ncbi:hypothetical protein AMK33_24130 [Streptomyces sp. CB02400]|nr:hypothetical protein AMK33_24130 [Streptomyces sp. CB02400]
MVTGGKGCRYFANGTIHAFVLPDAQRQPTQGQEMCIGFLVSEGAARSIWLHHSALCFGARRCFWYACQNQPWPRTPRSAFE